MRIPRWWLTASGLLCAIGALAHVLIPLGGPTWYRFAGAPQGIVAMAAFGSARPVISCIVIACVLCVFVAYAFSALGFRRRLAGQRVVIGLIGLVLSLRAVAFPIVAFFAPAALERSCGRCGSLNGFVFTTSLLCLIMGVGFLLGAMYPNSVNRKAGLNA